MHLIQLLPTVLLLACEQEVVPVDDAIDESAHWSDTLPPPVATEGDFTRSVDGRGEKCVLMDDGDERVVFPGPPPREVPGEFTLISRGQHPIVEVEGRLVSVYSEFGFNTNDVAGW